MNTHADKTSENKDQAVANSLLKQQSNGGAVFQLVDNRPEAIAQRKMQEAVNNSPQVRQLRAYQEIANNSPGRKKSADGRHISAASDQNIIQRITADELRERGNKIRRANAERVPVSGVNLWRMENQPENALIYVLGTAHALKLSEMGANTEAREYLIGFLQQENFSHVYTEVAADLPHVIYDEGLAGKLEEKVKAKQLLDEHFPGGQPEQFKDNKHRIDFLRKQQEVTKTNSGLQGIDDLGLDNSYAAIASIRRTGPRPVVGALETNETRLAAHNQNKGDLETGDADAEHRLRRAPGEHISSNDSVVKGNQQDLFVEASEEMLAGRDIASAEQRNKQWMDRVKDMNLVKKGDRQLWIVGAAHLPGLILRFSELGWRPQHMAPPVV